MDVTNLEFRIGLSTNKLKDLQNDSTRKAYSKVATDCLVYCLGVITGDITEFKTSFTQEMADAADNFLTALQTTSTSDQDDALQSFLFSVFSQKRCGTPDKYSFLIYSFLVLYSFSEDGTLKPCNTFSQYNSKVIFFGRSTLFNRIMSDADRDEKGFFEWVHLCSSRRADADLYLQSLPNIQAPFVDSIRLPFVANIQHKEPGKEDFAGPIPGR